MPIRLLALILLSVLAGLAETPNIVVILADDLGYGDVSAYNPESKAPTHNIDRLAADGLRFTDAHAPAALCVPTRYGLMTGRYPMRTELPWREHALIDQGRMTLASLLRGAGYQTAMVGKWHLGFEGGNAGPRFTNMRGGPLDRGFDSYFGLASSLDQPPFYYVRGRDAVEPPTEHVDDSSSPGWSPIQGAFWRAGPIAPHYRHQDVLPKLTEEAEQVIAKRDPAKPLFLYLAFTAPHTPWLPLDQFKGKGKAGLYGEFLTQVDYSVGRVLDALDKAGMKENTLVVFTSDNGPVWYDSDDERFGHRAAGPLRGMKADSYEGGHRMPFLVRWPGRAPASAVSSQTLCFTDLLATFAELVGAKVPSGSGEDSFSMLAAFQGGRSDTRTATVYKEDGDVIRMGRWKLITHLGSGGFSEPRKQQPQPGGPTGQLYDLEWDLGETRNLWLERPDVVRQLSAELERIKKAGRSR
ncbi:MAG: arylsulfatase [Acidobacteria bacterium]|nr:arylsulfatase [Acidobacteriota bacterium]